MSDASFASLSPSLLARKGGARPAMRPQHGAPGKIDGKDAAAGLEDLGWNDMGHDSEDEVPPGEIVRFEPAFSAVPAVPQTEAQSEQEPDRAPGAKPAASPVRDTIDRIARKLETPRLQAADTATAKAPARLSGQRRAAFTLRLDPERHLKLRLASTVSGCSAQVLVTEALDALLARMPEIDALAAQVKRL